MNELNNNKIAGKWLEIKGEVQKAWGKLTDSELEQTKGDMKAVGGLIQQRYGDKQEEYSNKLSDIYKRFSEKKEEKVENVKESLKN